MTTGGGPDLVQVLVHLSPCSDLPTGGEGADCPLPMPLAPSVSMVANTWPLPVLCLMGLLAAPLPTPLPANTLLGEEAGFHCITLHTSPPVMLLEEVLILGAILGDEDRFVLAAEGNTVTICILSPITTLDERDMDPTTSGHSSTLRPGKFDRPVTCGLMNVGSKTSRDWEDHEKTSGVDALRGCPIMGSKLYSAGRPIKGKLVGSGS